VGMSSLSGIYSTPILGVAYCLAEAQLTDACYSTSVNGPSQVLSLQPTSTRLTP